MVEREREREKKKCERGCHNTEKYGKKGHKRGGAITCERGRNKRGVVKRLGVREILKGVEFENLWTPRKFR